MSKRDVYRAMRNPITPRVVERRYAEDVAQLFERPAGLDLAEWLNHFSWRR